MNVFNDLLITSRMAFVKAMGLIKRSPGIFLLGVPYVILYTLGVYVSSLGGFLGSLVLFMIECALISSYLYYIHECINFGKIDVSLFRHSFSPYFSKVMGVLFILWLADYLLGGALMVFGVLGGFLPIILSILIKLAVFVMLNGMPETIYQKHYNEPETILYALRFVRDNPINWVVPNILIGVVVLIVFNIGLAAIPMALLTGKMGMVGMALSSMMGMLLSSILVSPVMVFRGALFEILSSSSRRKRYFMRDMYH